jgi:hypothetical protein
MLTRRDLAGVGLAGAISTGASAEASAQPATGRLAIIGTIEVVSGRRDVCLPLLMAHRARCLNDEPGTLSSRCWHPVRTIQKCFSMKSIKMTPHSMFIGMGHPPNAR